MQKVIGSNPIEPTDPYLRLIFIMNKIKITFPDGNSREYDKGITALKIAESISPRLADDALAAEVNSIVKLGEQSPVRIQGEVFPCLQF